MCMKKLAAIICVLFLISFSVVIQSCNQNEKSDAEKKIVNPNGDSELALLMRDMADHVTEQKKNLSEGKMPSAYPDKFNTITTAKPTEEKMKGNDFDNMAAFYLKNLKSYCESKSLQDAIDNHNMLVQSCAVCHEQTCPGPLTRINKLKME